MTAWIPSALETLGFASASDATAKRRAVKDGRDATKAPRYRSGQYCASLDAYISLPKQPTTHELLPVENGADYDSMSSISDTDSLRFDGLYPARSTKAPTGVNQPRTSAKQPLLPPKTIVPAAPRAVASPSKDESAEPASVPDSPSAPWTPGTSLAEKWSTRPSKRAREIVSNASNPRQSIVNEIQEPEYSMRDVEISEGFEELKNLMAEFSELHFRFEVKVGGSLEGKLLGLAPDFYKQFGEETAKVIGCVASGGPGGVQGWHDLFIERVKRMALVTGIVGNVLVEQVFQHLFFGGAERYVADLVEMQKKDAEEDGFVRNTHHATYIRSILDPKSSNSFTLPTNFANHVNHTVGALITHLSPILKLDATHPSASTLIPHLHTIVTHAGLLSLAMHADPHTVYHFAPIFKEETFSAARMECFNARTMQQTNPLTPETDPGLRASEKRRRAALSDAEKARARNDDALTQITLMNGVAAYRVGGWEDVESTVTDVRYETAGHATRGVRERVLSKAWAYCRWGRARKFKDGRADDRAAQHGVVWKGGFKEFTDVEGVRNWVKSERGEKKKGEGLTEAEIQEGLNEE